MGDHYYSAKPGSASDKKLIRCQLRGFQLSFWTDSGVFSKGGIDFGSQLLIETMDIPKDAKVLDVGCGYGPIGLTAAKLAEKGTVQLVDVNERAVELAAMNAGQNGIQNVEFHVSDGFDQVKDSDFDRILTNPPIRAGKAVIYKIFEDAATHLRTAGQLWVVIQKKQGAPSAKKKLEELFQQVDDVARNAGYRIFRCEKPISPGQGD